MSLKGEVNEIINGKTSYSEDFIIRLTDQSSEKLISCEIDAFSSSKEMKTLGAMHCYANAETNELKDIVAINAFP